MKKIQSRKFPLSDSSRGGQAGQQKSGEIDRDQHHHSENVREDHASDVVAGFTEIGEAANGAAREHAVRPAAEERPAVTVRAALPECVLSELGPRGGLRPSLVRVRFVPTLPLYSSAFACAGKRRRTAYGDLRHSASAILC